MTDENDPLFVPYPEHSHEPEFEIEPNLGNALTRVIAADPNEDEGEDHYFLHITHGHEGVVMDVYDIHGEEVLATLALTYGELVAHIFANDPGAKEGR